ncbi:MAG TPA: glycosyltransferase [Candidatus Thalassarchaeaceae archaeon]|nr:glycosyltransferase [Candidatus Thalassarchaeaceae archaeon]
MGKRALLVRGGALPISSGFGRAHQATVQRLKSGLVSGWEILKEIDHKIDDAGSIKRLRRRWFSHPGHVQKIANQQQPDLIHITDQEQAHLVPKNAHCPVVVTVHDLFLFDPTVMQTSWGPIDIGNRKTGFVRRMDLQRLKKGLRRADLAICISQATADHLSRLIPGMPTVIVPNSVDLKARDPRTNLRPRPELPEDSLHLLIVGSEDRRKALGFVLDVIGKIDSEIRHQIVVHKVGAESDSFAEKRLKEHASKLDVNLRWHGKVEEEELIALEQHCDALLFPSAAEGFGLPVVEAMASGCPILVNDLGAQNEHPPSSCILPPFDISSWRDAILKMNQERIARGSTNRLPRDDLLEAASSYSVEAISSFHTDAYATAIELKK